MHRILIRNLYYHYDGRLHYLICTVFYWFIAFSSTLLVLLYVWFPSAWNDSLISLQNDGNWTAFWCSRLTNILLQFILVWSITLMFLKNKNVFLWWTYVVTWMLTEEFSLTFSIFVFPSSFYVPEYEHWNHIFSFTSIWYRCWRVISANEVLYDSYISWIIFCNVIFIATDNAHIHPSNIALMLTKLKFCTIILLIPWCSLVFWNPFDEEFSLLNFLFLFKKCSQSFR